ncbi:MAG: PAS domain-containing protein [Candidatus Doudnabacteria bacterium]|nr:PAS domain-containing protein [Candidatus Doudnabacteria bacterium]
MLLNIILIVDLVLLTIMIGVYIHYTLRERYLLQGQVGQAHELQQRIYQIQVLKEIGERIGYSLDTNKIVEIITSSLGSLLEYDTVSYMVLQGQGERLVFKCHVNNTVTHEFLEEVREKMLLSVSAILNRDFKPELVDESITGNILDDNLQVSLQSYFNLPVVIGEKLVGLINVGSQVPGQYGDAQASILYSITNQASTAVSKLQAVLESEKGKLAAVINSMTDGVVMVDMHNQVLVSNPAVRSLLEIAGGQETTMYDVVDALAGKVDVRTKIEQAIGSRSPIVIHTVQLKNHVVELTITPVRSQQGDQLGAAVVFHDITTEKDLEKLRQDFTAMMVHELRAPLTAVRWSSESLGKMVVPGATIEPKKVEETALTISSASRNMLELVNDLLDVAKIEAGKFDLNLQEYDLVAIIKDQLLTFKALAEQKRLQLNDTLPDKFMVKCDKVRISQALENLLSNAIKYTDSGQVMVTLTADQQNKRATVAVKDSGVGVSREDISQLFSKFRQLKNTDNARKGTGLGLVVSKGIVEAHGGQIWAESAGDNMGTTFYFTLPL